MFLCAHSYVACCWFCWCGSCGDPWTLTGPNQSPSSRSERQLFMFDFRPRLCFSQFLFLWVSPSVSQIRGWMPCGLIISANRLASPSSSQSRDLTNALSLTLMDVSSCWLPVAATGRLQQLHICCPPTRLYAFSCITLLSFSSLSPINLSGVAEKPRWLNEVQMWRLMALLRVYLMIWSHLGRHNWSTDQD